MSKQELIDFLKAEVQNLRKIIARLTAEQRKKNPKSNQRRRSVKRG